MAEKLNMETKDITQLNIQKIQALFPNCVKEIKNDEGESILAVDFDILKQELSSSLIDDKKERYNFTWPEKNKHILLANTRVSSCLRPIIDKSIDFESTQNVYI